MSAPCRSAAVAAIVVGLALLSGLPAAAHAAAPATRDVLVVGNNGDARLRVAVQRPRRGRWGDARVVTRKLRAGSRRVALGRLRVAGRYRVAFRATDDAGNDSARRLVRFRIRG